MICSECKKLCEAHTWDILESSKINGGVAVKGKVFWRTETLSLCCAAPIIYEDSTHIDEVDTPGGHLPYQGGGE